jgi:hypothetical protein
MSAALCARSTCFDVRRTGTVPAVRATTIQLRAHSNSRHLNHIRMHRSVLCFSSRKISECYVIFEVFTAVTMKNTIF